MKPRWWMTLERILRMPADPPAEVVPTLDEERKAIALVLIADLQLAIAPGGPCAGAIFEASVAKLFKDADGNPAYYAVTAQRRGLDGRWELQPVMHEYVHTLIDLDADELKHARAIQDFKHCRLIRCWTLPRVKFELP